MKNLGIKSIATFFALLMIFTSTAQTFSISKSTFETQASERTFDFSTYERFKGDIIDIKKLDIPTKVSRLEQNKSILEQVNNIYETEVNFDEELMTLNTSEKIFSWLVENTNFNEKDVLLITNYSNNLVSNGFEKASKTLSEQLSKHSIESVKFEKYQSIVNTVKLIEYQYPGTFTTETVQKGGWGCAFAIAKLALATASLAVACNPPALGATVGVGCYLAGTGFVAASVSVGLACKD
ncbi:hypothetical protein [Nonlabens sp.]|uniref:hypothetical protein n=1 Tax=Nonlabens sp. TaxID=1888209 RepID=UPI003F69D049